MTRPETWAPTCTVPTADSVPLAVTCAAIGPLETITVENVIGSSPLAQGLLTRTKAIAPAASASTTIRGIQRFTCTVGNLIPRYEASVARVLRFIAARDSTRLAAPRDVQSSPA